MQAEEVSGVDGVLIWAGPELGGGSPLLSHAGGSPDGLKEGPREALPMRIP